MPAGHSILLCSLGRRSYWEITGRLPPAVAGMYYWHYCDPGFHPVSDAGALAIIADFRFRLLERAAAQDALVAFKGHHTMQFRISDHLTRACRSNASAAALGRALLDLLFEFSAGRTLVWVLGSVWC